MAAASTMRKPLLTREEEAEAGYGGMAAEGSAHLLDHAGFDGSFMTDSPPIAAAASFAAPAWDATSGDDDQRPIILIAGPRRSGKTSVHHVLFHKLSPHETMFLGPTMAVIPEVIAHNDLLQFEVWDLPGDHGLTTDIRLDDGTTVAPADALRRCGALVFVVDAQEGVDEEAAELMRDIGRAVSAHAPSLSVDVFVHKIDGDALQSAEARMEAQADVQLLLSRALRESGLGGFSVAYHATSVYDGTVYEAVSRVVQRLLPQRAALTQVLDRLVSTSGLASAAVYDVVSKVHIARDSGGHGDAAADLIGDALDVVVDVACIYGVKGGAAAAGEAAGEAGGDEAGAEADAEAEEDDGYQFDDDTEAQVTLADGNCMLLRAVGPYLALVAVAPTSVVAQGSRLGAIDCNVDSVRHALRDLFRPGASRADAAITGLMLPPPAAESHGEGSVVSAAGSINP